jgi:hypothetical protein
MDTLSPTATPLAIATRHPDDSGVVTGRPRTFLRVEGLALLAAALVAYSHTGQAWWLLPATLLLPDLGAVGYLLSRRTGALLYNPAHATPLPFALLGLGLWQGNMLVVALALVWFAHIGMDRAMAYGLKHDDDPGHTHLGWHGRQRHS